MRNQNFKNSAQSSPGSSARPKYSRYNNLASLQRQNLQQTMNLEKLKEDLQSMKLSKRSLQIQNERLKEKISTLEISQKKAHQKQKNFSRQKFELLTTFGIQHKQANKSKFSEIASFKEILNLLVSLLKEGSVEGEYFTQILNQISKTSTELIDFIQSPHFTEKLADLRSIHKSNKNEMMEQLRKKFEQAVKKVCQEERELMEKERSIIRQMPENLKQIKEASKSREQIYSKHIYILQKQIKQKDIAYQTMYVEFKKQNQKLAQKNASLLKMYNRDLEVPIANLIKKVEAEIQAIKVQFQKANKMSNIKTVSGQLISVINRYLKQRQEKQAIKQKSDAQNLTMQHLEEANRKLDSTLNRIDETFSKRELMHQQINQFFQTRIKKELQKSQEKKMFYNAQELQTKTIYQREYIVMLQKYQAKLQSCIKRISADTTFQNEWKRQKQEYDQRKSAFQTLCSQVQESNEKVVSQLIQLKKTQMQNKNQTSQLKSLFEQCLEEIKQLKIFKEELVKFMQNQRNLKKLIHEQTYKFNSVFTEHYSNLVVLKESIPVLKNPAIYQQKKQKCLPKSNQQMRKTLLQLKQNYEELAKCKKVVQTRLSKGINDILRAHQQYLKFARIKAQSICLSIDQKQINNMGNRIYIKVEEIYGTIRQFKESVFKIESQSKSNYQNSKIQAKKLLNYMRSTKMDQYIVNLINVVEKDQKYLDQFMKLLNADYRTQ